MTRATVITNGFVLAAYKRLGRPGSPLTVYIEGDGYAWRSRRRLSRDPTPTDPVALRLAAQDPSENVVYLARPCQFIAPAERRRCRSVHWSTRRFSEAVIAASSLAIEQFRQQAKAAEITLVGYSGGAAVAALVAARRSDIRALRTVAGNLDHAAFTAYHRITPLDGSSNPLDAAAALAALPQRHYVGAEDRVVPPFIVENFIRRLGPGNCAALTIVPGMQHDGGWAELWPRLLALPVGCTPPLP